jgi:hypothetical protein
LLLRLVAMQFTSRRGRNFGSGIFGWHMASMTLAWLLFATQGVFAYKVLAAMCILDFPWHIVAVRVQDVGITACFDRRARRKRHRSCMLAAGSVAVFGLLFILADKKKNHPDISSWLPHTVHGYLGALTMLLLLQQVISGVMKYSQLKYQIAPLAFHGWMGKVLIVAAYAAVLAGLLHVGSLAQMGGSAERKKEGLGDVVRYLLVALVAVQAICLFLVMAVMPIPPDSSTDESTYLNDPPIRVYGGSAV